MSPHDVKKKKKTKVKTPTTSGFLAFIVLVGLFVLSGEVLIISVFKANTKKKCVRTRLSD